TDPKKSSGRSPWTKTPRTPRAPKPNAPNNAGNTSVADRPPPRRTPDRSTPSRKNSGRTAKADPARTHPSPERPENRGSPAPENTEGQSPGQHLPHPGNATTPKHPDLGHPLPWQATTVKHVPPGGHHHTRQPIPTSTELEKTTRSHIGF